MRSSLLPMFLLAALAACEGASPDLGHDQPIRIRGAQLVESALPHEDVADGGTATGPAVTALVMERTTIFPGQAGKVISGRTSTNAVAVAIGFVDLGSAYWVAPVGFPDYLNGGEFTFNFTADFGADVPSGTHTLGLVAIGEDGRAGPLVTRVLCFLPDVPDNAATCSDAATLPDTVISLSWNADVDLDLVVVTPGGKVVSAKAPTTAAHDGGVPDAVLADPSTGILTRDANSQCRVDPIRRESLVFDGPPPAGTYAVYASLFSACSKPSVSFELTTYRATVAANGEPTLAATPAGSGQLLAVQQTGGSTLGSRITTITFP